MDSVYEVQSGIKSTFLMNQSHSSFTDVHLFQRMGDPDVEFHEASSVKNQPQVPVQKGT